MMTYICRTCAINAGGVWPDGHVATMHRAQCPECEEVTNLACWSDWDWPLDEKRNALANLPEERGGREV